MQKRALFLAVSTERQNSKTLQCEASVPRVWEITVHLATIHALEVCYRSKAGFATVENINKLSNRDGVKVLYSYAREVWEMSDLFEERFE